MMVMPELYPLVMVLANSSGSFGDIDDIDMRLWTIGGHFTYLHDDSHCNYYNRVNNVHRLHTTIHTKEEETTKKPLH